MVNIAVEMFRVLNSVQQELENNRTELEEDSELVDLDTFAEHIEELYDLIEDPFEINNLVPTNLEFTYLYNFA